MLHPQRGNPPACVSRPRASGAAGCYAADGATPRRQPARERRPPRMTGTAARPPASRNQCHEDGVPVEPRRCTSTRRCRRTCRTPTAAPDAAPPMARPRREPFNHAVGTRDPGRSSCRAHSRSPSGQDRANQRGVRAVLAHQLIRVLNQPYNVRVRLQGPPIGCGRRVQRARPQSLEALSSATQG